MLYDFPLIKLSICVIYFCLICGGAMTAADVFSGYGY